MLYPDFKELLSYESPAKSLGKHFGNKYTSSMSGDYMSNFRGQGMEFDEVRTYAYGDDVRNIDWRVSARTDDIYVKLFREEKQREVLIAVDCNDYMNFGTRKTFKNVIAAHISAILGFAANRNNDKAGFYIFGNRKDRFTFFKSVNSKKSILLGLKDQCKPQDHNNSYSLDGAIFNLRRLHILPNILFIISDFQNLTEDFEKNLFLLGSRTELVFIKITDDSDFKIPDVGDLQLKFGIKNFILSTSNKKGREQYQKDFDENDQRLKKIAINLQARLIEVNTKDDVIRKLTRGLAKK